MQRTVVCMHRRYRSMTESEGESLRSKSASSQRCLADQINCCLYLENRIPNQRINQTMRDMIDVKTEPKISWR